MILKSRRVRHAQEICNTTFILYIFSTYIPCASGCFPILLSGYHVDKTLSTCLLDRKTMRGTANTYMTLCLDLYMVGKHHRQINT